MSQRAVSRQFATNKNAKKERKKKKRCNFDAFYDIAPVLKAKSDIIKAINSVVPKFYYLDSFIA